MLIWIVRLVIVLFFLVMFLWRSKVSWGIGLLTASAVVLLDAMRAQSLLDEVGYVGYFSGGLIVAGAYFWANDMLGRYRAVEAPVSDEGAVVQRGRRPGNGRCFIDLI